MTGSGATPSASPKKRVRLASCLRRLVVWSRAGPPHTLPLSDGATLPTAVLRFLLVSTQAEGDFIDFLPPTSATVLRVPAAAAGRVLEMPSGGGVVRTALGEVRAELAEKGDEKGVAVPPTRRGMRSGSRSVCSRLAKLSSSA